MITLIPNWPTVGLLTLAEALLMAVLALLFWRHNARQPGRVLNYVLGCLGLLAGLNAWATLTPGLVSPWAAPQVFFCLLVGAGAGTCLPRAIHWWQTRRAVAEVAALEAEADHA